MAHRAAELLQIGYQARRDGRLGEALEAFAESVALSRDGLNEALLAEALTALAYTERSLKKITASLRDYRAAAEVYRRLDDPLRVAHTVRHVADILREEADLEDAEKNYEEALRIYGAHLEAPFLDLGNALRGFALLKEDQGEAQAARALWQQTQEQYSAVGVQAGMDECERRLLLLADA